MELKNDICLVNSQVILITPYFWNYIKTKKKSFTGSSASDTPQNQHLQLIKFLFFPHPGLKAG